MKRIAQACILLSIGFVGCSPDIATLEARFIDKIESAFHDKSWEQISELHEFRDEPQKYIEEMREHWERRFDRGIESIVFEEISGAIQTRMRAGVEYDGVWYRADPEPYKLVRLIYKKEERKDGDSQNLGVSMSTPVALKDGEIIFPGFKQMKTPPKPIKMVLPDDFVGKFSVIWLESGIDVEETGDSLVYIFPAGGELAVASLDPFVQDRPKVIEFRDGRRIFEAGENEAGKDGFYFDPDYMTISPGRIGAPGDTASSEYHGTKLSWRIKEKSNKPE